MVLEEIIRAETARRNPLKIIFLSALFASIAAVIVFLLRIEPGDYLLLVFTLIPSVHFITALIDCDEERETEKKFLGSHTLARHSSTIAVFLAFFLGLIIAFSFWYLALPPQDSAKMFSLQQRELQKIQGAFSGFALQKFSEEKYLDAFETIFLHNLEVLALVIGFSLLYSAGAVFVLIWNASVISVFLGNVAKQTSLVAGLGAGTMGLLPHGSFEILAYSTAALAGGILSRAVIRRKLESMEFFQTAYDAAKLSAWAILFFAVAAIIESTGAVG